jgi:multiple sugar transport system permease protein
VTAPPRPRRSKGAFSARLDRLAEGRFAAVMSAPGLLLVLLIIGPPVLAAIVFSFFRIELTSPGTEPFVGLRNYVVRLPADAEFLGTLPFTLAFAAITTAVAVPVALGAALLVHSRRRFRGALALLMILPWAVAPIGDGLLWRLLFDPLYGLVGKLLRYAGLPPVDVTTAPGSVLAMVVAVTWRAMPLLAVLFLGALRQVPPDLARAARMDGASSWQILRRITLPAIAPMLIAATLIEIVLTFQVFDIQFAMTADLPPAGTTLAAMEIYRTVIENISLGYGATETMVLGFVVGVCVWLLWVLVVRRNPDGEPLAAQDDETEPRRRRPPVASPATAPLQRWDVKVTRTRFRRPRATLGRLAGAAGALLLTIWVLGPFLWIAIASVQSDALTGSDPPQFGLPLMFGIYQAFMRSSMWQGAAVVSLVVASISTSIALAIAALAAYPLARYRLRGGRALLMTLLGTQLIPPIALALPILYIFIRLNIKNTVPGLILLDTAFWTPILVYLLRAAFIAVPRNLDHAARIDGSSRLGVVFRIVIPAAAPAIAAATAIVFIGIWNDFVFVATIGGRDTNTLASFLGASSSPSFQTLSAKLMLTILPCLAMIVVLRRRILRLT